MLTPNKSKYFLYIIIDIMSGIIDYSIFFITFNKINNISPEFASVLGQTTGFIFSFLFNIFINFKIKNKLFKRFLYNLTISLIGMVISTILIHLLKYRIDIYILKGIALISVSIITMLLNICLTYRKTIC